MRCVQMLSGIKHIFTGPGDWVPPPRSPDNPAFEPEKKVDGACSAGFSFVNDVAVRHLDNSNITCLRHCNQPAWMFL